jgi:hypothetical protein
MMRWPPGASASIVRPEASANVTAPSARDTVTRRRGVVSVTTCAVDVVDHLGDVSFAGATTTMSSARKSPVFAKVTRTIESVLT